ncbi:subtilisin-like protease SBT5.4 [Papaver somniferum]|uniref:subtilisin-like protease SBT5.4 n=1 Tax=Papaver somniferum TaxID=3469 RepID=UPI000E7028FA|nr:subtilisin-like protease SBT5.4 [Papaver somniferum]
MHELLQSYVVYLGRHHHGPELSSVDLEQVSEQHHEILGSFLGSRAKAKQAIYYSYTKNINGFAANLDQEEAREISKHPNVISVFEDKGKELQTTKSWEFIGLEHNGEVLPGSLWERARFGENVIIGSIDTGVWPESASFREEGMGPIPSKWKGGCYDDITENGVPCNRKLIGARYFKEGWEINTQNVSPGYITHAYHNTRDRGGHGTHILSTTGGHFVDDANMFGLANGTAKGGSPNARVAAYKVCWPEAGIRPECSDADIMAGIDAAIHDNVDILSISLGQAPIDYLSDSIAIGSLYAVMEGITVVCSAGNNGTEGQGGVNNVAPWMITVGASTIDREFRADIELGNNLILQGQSMSSLSLPKQKFYPLVDGRYAGEYEDMASTCEVTGLIDEKVKGKIVVCLRGGSIDKLKASYVNEIGGVGIILVSNKEDLDEIHFEAHELPSIRISYFDGLSLFSYMNSTESPVGYITNPRTEMNITPAPVVASFSSTGPNSIAPEILKPDVLAPGVDIIAAFNYIDAPISTRYNDKKVFNIMSGTSMACPHVTGVVGLLKSLHPEWSPAAIKSAIMTTARTRSNARRPIQTVSGVSGTPFSYGAGHIRPTRAMDPGLVYDLAVHDYLDFLCSTGANINQVSNFANDGYKCKKIRLVNFNYPAITIPILSRPVTVTRTVKNVGSPGTYIVKAIAPLGVTMNVKPKRLKFEKIGEDKTFNVTLKVKRGYVIEKPVFGKLIWYDGVHYVRSPIIVMEGKQKSS